MKRSAIEASTDAGKDSKSGARTRPPGPLELLRELERRRITCRVGPGGDLLLAAPVLELSPDFLSAIRACRNELVAALKTHSRWKPLSSGERVCYRDFRRQPGTEIGNVAAAVRIKSVVDVARLRRALMTVVTRHPMLRATYRWIGDEPERCILPGHLRFSSSSLSERTDAELVDAIRPYYRAPFDLSAGLVFRAHLFQHGSTESILLISAHHAVTDGLSLSVVLNDVRLAYAHGTRALPAAGSAPLASYETFVHDQQLYLAAAEHEADWTYWRATLEGAPLALRFGNPTSLPAVHALGQSVPCEVPEGVSRAVHDVARTLGVTPFVVLFSAWAALLARSTGVSDFVAGTPIAGRAGQRFRGVVGNFMNLVPIRIRCADDTLFARLVDDVQRQIALARHHGRLPFAELVARLGRQTNVDPAGVAPVGFTLQRAHGPLTGRAMKLKRGPVDFGGLSVEPIGLPLLESAFDVALELYGFGETFRGFAKGRADSVSQGDLARLSDAYPVVLAELVGNPAGALVQSRASSPPFLRAEPREPAAATFGSDDRWSTIEKRVVGLWEEIGVRPAHSRHSFFEAGGHSLLATQLVTRIAREFDVTLGLRDIFEAPTVADLAVLVNARVARRS